MDSVASVRPILKFEKVGFQYDGAHAKAYSYKGLPGTWTGVAYDFVRGGRGLTIPGLPAASAGCLDGT